MQYPTSHLIVFSWYTCLPKGSEWYTNEQVNTSEEWDIPWYTCTTRKGCQQGTMGKLGVIPLNCTD